MDNDSNIKRRDEMLSRFRESLNRPLSERYFDEDELIEIFDFAGDLNDDYLRIEALMCAARFFPDSEAIRQRKAIFYTQYSEDAGTKYINDNESATGMLWDIMRARKSNPVDEKSCKEILDNILSSYDKISDEEVIQFIDLVSSLGQIQWLKDNMDTLRSKADYLNLLLYEISIAADCNGDANLSVDVLEELTNIEPFNHHFWMMLAKMYAVKDEHEKALTAIDYALAIEPEDAQSLFIKSKLLYTSNNQSSEAIDLLQKVLEIEPEASEAAKLLAVIYNDLGDKDKSIRILAELIEKHPEQSINVIPELIMYRPDNISELLDIYYQVTDEPSQIMWSSWAHHLAINGFQDISNEVFKAYTRNSGNKIYSLVPIEYDFNAKRFEEAIDELSEYLDKEANSDTDFPTMVIIHLLSMIKVGEMDKALEFCDFLESHSSIKQYTNISGRLEYVGMLKIVRQIKQRLKRTLDPSDWIDYDPLGIWD